MSLSSDELNYMIWRYFQESGLDVSAYALEDETKINLLDENYSNMVPLGCLVDLIQKGILYTKINDLVKVNNANLINQDEIANLNLNFFSALNEIKKNEDVTERTISHIDDSSNSIRNDNTEINNSNNIIDDKENKDSATSNTDNVIDTKQPNDDDDFINIIKPSSSFDPTLSLSFSPSDANSLAYSKSNSCIIYSLNDKSAINLPLPSYCKDLLHIIWSNDGNNLVTASENGEIKIWLNSGLLKNTLSMHNYPILNICYSPSNKFLASLDIQNNVIIWNSNTGSVVLYIDKENISKFLNNDIKNNSNNNNSNICGSCLCWIDETKFIIPGLKNTLLVCQINDNNHNPIIGVLKGHEDLVSIVKYNSDLKLLCSGSNDGQIRIWKGNSINSLQILIGHSLPLSTLEWIKFDNNWYILSTSLDGTIRIWDFINNKLLDLASIDDSQAILCGDYNSEKQILVLGDSSGCVSIWSLKNLKLHQTGLYQPQINKMSDDSLNESNKSYISEISFNNEKNIVAVGYTHGQSVVINV